MLPEDVTDARPPGAGSSSLEDARRTYGAHRRNVTRTARNAASVETITIAM
jgi:hypothetical protein